MLKEINSAKKIDLSFDFSIINMEDRELTLSVNGLLRDIEFNEETFTWFLEDLVHYMLEQKIQRRWDLTNIVIKNCRSMKINDADFNKLKEFVKSVAQWDLHLIK